MTHFPQNLSLLRRRAGYTQETLAEALSVSRQAVSKWESGLTLPEADKLLALADLLDCTLDQLLREDLSLRLPAVPDGPNPEEEALFAAYDSHMNRFSLMISAGVVLILLGVAALLLCYTLLGESGLIVLPLLLCLAISVFLFVYGGVAHSEFQAAHPQVPDLRTEEEKRRFSRAFRLGMAFSVALILVDVALLVGLAAFFGDNEPAIVRSTALFLTILAGAVGALVLLGILHSKFEPAEAAEDDGPEGAIMLAATAIFLAAGFLFDAWHPAWVVFPIGGLLCAMIPEKRKK